MREYLLRTYLSDNCHSIFVNKLGDQVSFEGPEKVKEAYKFLGRYAVTPFEVVEEITEDGMQKNESYSIATPKGNVHLTLITYKGGKYA